MAGKRTTAPRGTRGSRSKRRPARQKGNASSREWESFERSVLQAQQPGAGQRGAAAEGGEDSVLFRLAERSQILRAREKPMGNVVFLHGITGSDLAVSSKGGRPDGIWVSIVKLVRGEMAKLRLAPDGATEHDPSLRVRPTGVNKRFYGRAVLALRARWNVEPFAYDWRRDIDEASDDLAAFIRQRFPGEPVHLVAHSMGGLVARNFIRRHRDLWASMKDPELVRGGRLVMLGTPNYGSYAIVQVLSGADALLSRLERFDLKHNMNQLLEITNSFVGTYQLLPAFSRLQVAEQRLYERTTWGRTRGISQEHFNRAIRFHEKLDVPANMDEARLCHVAGVNQTTIGGVRILAPGEFEYDFTLEGDGRVPLKLGLIDGVPTYYIDELHGDLAKNEQVLLALDELLQKGATTQLAATAAAAMGEGASGAARAARAARAYRANDRAALDLLSDLASRTRLARDADALSDEEKLLAADAILNAAVSARVALPAARPAPPREAAKRRPRAPAAPPVTLRIGARFGSIEEFRAPLVVVGHYRGVKPVRAIGAIDEKLNGWLDRAIRRGMISGQVGETFFVPTRGTPVPAQGVIVAGMGEYGAFRPGLLRRMMANVATAATALRIQSLGTVLIGAGEGGLPMDLVLRQIIEGFGSGIAELREEQAGRRALSSTLWIVERDPQRFAIIDSKIEALAERAVIDGVRLQYVPASAPELKAARKASTEGAGHRFSAIVERRDRAATGLSPGRAQSPEVRLTIECEDDGPKAQDGARRFTISALTNSALVPVQQVEVSAAVVEDLARGLSEATAPASQEQFGRLLFRYLLPREFESLLDAHSAIRLIVDPASAAFPWEMACMPTPGAPGELQRFGTDRRMTRQFKSLLSGAAGLIPPRNEKLRALVIADPAPEPEWQLPGAQAEGAAVARLLRFANGLEFPGTDTRLDIEVHEFNGHAECDPLDLIARLTSGDYDLVHFAGHGNYSGDDPSRSGWVLSAEHYVTPRDIARSRQTPWLIVANACFSAVVSRERHPLLREARSAASIAESFMQLGVRNYLGTGWMVDDAQALRFAQEFYGWLLFGNRMLSEALSSARQEILAEGQGSTWGAYQLYGDPGDRLLPRLDGQGESFVAECRRRFEANEDA